VAHSLIHIPRAALDAALDLLFPPKCVSCGTRGDVWCVRCDRSLRRLSGRLCTWCGAPISRGHVCPTCERRPPPLMVRSFARYKPPLIAAILMLKYQPNRVLAHRMAVWLEDLVRKAAWRLDGVVPVPLAPERFRARGYNQAELISHELAALLHLASIPEMIVRERETRTQVGLHPEDRWRNVLGAFRANPELAAGQAVLLVDDLYTTGATLTACAEALYEAGAAQVFGVTVGRAG
jgi:competence protein ComFC